MTGAALTRQYSTSQSIQLRHSLDHQLALLDGTQFVSCCMQQSHRLPLSSHSSQITRSHLTNLSSDHRKTADSEPNILVISASCMQEKAAKHFPDGVRFHPGGKPSNLFSRSRPNLGFCRTTTHSPESQIASHQNICKTPRFRTKSSIDPPLNPPKNLFYYK